MLSGRFATTVWSFVAAISPIDSGVAQRPRLASPSSASFFAPFAKPRPAAAMPPAASSSTPVAASTSGAIATPVAIAAPISSGRMTSPLRAGSGHAPFGSGVGLATGVSMRSPNARTDFDSAESNAEADAGAPPACGVGERVGTTDETRCTKGSGSAA